MAIKKKKPILVSTFEKEVSDRLAAFTEKAAHTRDAYVLSIQTAIDTKAAGAMPVPVYVSALRKVIQLCEERIKASE